MSAEVSQTIRSVTFHVEGLDCPDEVRELRDALAGLDGIVDLTFQIMQARMTVRFDPRRVSVEQIIDRVATTGMKATPAGDERRQQLATRLPRGPLVLTILAAAGTAAGLILDRLGGPVLYHTTLPAAAAYLLAIAAAWRYVAPRALTALRRLRLDMNVLMTIAVAGAIALGEWFEAATVAFLFALSNLLETWSVSKARAAIAALMDLAPPTARLLDSAGREQDVPVEQVTPGARIVVRPGEKIPLDGVVEQGATSVDQSPITGESTPIEKGTGDEVFAGTINHDGAIVVRVTHAAGETVLAGIVRLVEQAQQQRSRSEQFVERFARWYTPAAVIGAALLCVVPPLVFGAAWSTWFYRSLVLLVIACPCALVISTPVSIVSGLAAAARNGVLIKGGEFLEAVGRIRALALDKTGTLTYGRPQVEEVLPVNHVSPDELLRVAAALEQRSEHPIASAIVQHAAARGIRPPACDDFQAIRGKGAIGTVDGTEYLLGNHRLLEERGLCSEHIHRTMLEHEDCHHIAIALASRDRPLGVVLLADALRPEAPQTIAALRRTGIRRIVMLTGDNEGTAKAIAEQCGGIEYRAELLPADKVAAVRELADRYHDVAMVGDGINDAPALAAATVGIAMGVQGTDAALETADVALMTDELPRLPWLVRHSRRTRATIVQNIAFSLAVKAVFVVLAIPGLANLWMAIAADTGAALLVTLNGLRLLRK